MSGQTVGLKEICFVGPDIHELLAGNVPVGSVSVCDMILCDILTAVGLPAGDSSTVHIYTQTVHRTAQNKQYTGCPRRNMPDFGRVFLMLKYTDITQNTYVQS